MQAPRYLKGVSRSNSWIMSWSQQELTSLKEGHNVSHIIDTRQRDIMFVNQDRKRIRGRLKTAEANFSWTYRWHDTGFGIIWHQRIWGHDDMEKSRWVVKRITQTHGGKWKTRWDIPNPTWIQTSAMFKSNILPTWQSLWFHFPHHIWRVPQLFLITSLKGIAYACNINPS